MPDDASRRPLKSRQRAWIRQLARFFVGLGVTPNQMSLASVGAAVLGAVAYAASTAATSVPRFGYLIAAAIFIQLRLLANILDGLMALEEGQRTPTGAIYNEVPDRFADMLFLVAAGYAADFPVLGWISALLAVLTAYLRAFGASLGFGQDFCGPMAKQHRMFTLTIGSVLAGILPGQPVLALTLGVIVVGAAITVGRRMLHLVGNSSARHQD